MRRDEEQTERRTELTIATGSESSTEQNTEQNRVQPTTADDSADFSLDDKDWIIMDDADFGTSAIHGIGVFATRDLEAGTKIIQEPALWIVDKATAIKASFPTSLDATEMRRTLIESFELSNPHEEEDERHESHKSKILELCGGFTEDDDKPADQAEADKMLSEKLREILILNAVQQKGDWQAEWAAIFEGSCRLNHSCAPNAQRMTATVTGGICYSEVTATSRINKGDEITISYVDPLAVSVARQEMLGSRWRFSCGCKLCSRSQREIAASDKRRTEMSAALGLLLAYEATGSDRVAVGDLGWKRLDALAIREGVNDLTLFQAMRITSDAARRMKKVSLETELVRRMLAASSTFGFNRQTTQALRDRLGDLERSAAEAVALVAAYLAGRQCGRREPAWTGVWRTA